MPGAEAIVYNPREVPLARRLVVRTVVGSARLLARQPPRRIAAVLRLLERGSRPASLADAARARESVELVSMRCAGPRGCLPRSLAIVLLCRLRGRWPVWCVGVRPSPPFLAHAWVEAEGDPVGEDFEAGYFRHLLTVP